MYEDNIRKLEAIDGRVRYTHKIKNIVLNFDPERCGLIDNLPTNPYMKHAVAALKAQGESPKSWFCVQADGQFILLPNAARKIIEQTAKANADAREAAITPAQRERWAIDGLFAKAERLIDYPGSYFPALRNAQDALAAWREKYPEMAREEDRRDLLSRAEHQESLASGALTYDADGWLSQEDQEARAAEFKAKAEELRAQAAKL